MQTNVAQAETTQDILSEADKWELLCWEERCQKAQILLGVAEGERARAQQRIAAAHGIDTSRPYRFLPDGRIVQE
jgi:hypothetical protein